MKSCCTAIPAIAEEGAKESRRSSKEQEKKQRRSALALPGESRLTLAHREILVVDLGGTQVKILATGETDVRKASSGRSMTELQ